MTQCYLDFMTKAPYEVSRPFSASPRIEAPIGVDSAGFAALENLPDNVTTRSNLGKMILTAPGLCPVLAGISLAAALAGWTSP